MWPFFKCFHFIYFSVSFSVHPFCWDNSQSKCIPRILPLFFWTQIHVYIYIYVCVCVCVCLCVCVCACMLKQNKNFSFHLHLSHRQNHRNVPILFSFFLSLHCMLKWLITYSLLSWWCLFVPVVTSVCHSVTGSETKQYWCQPERRTEGKFTLILFQHHTVDMCLLHTFLQTGMQH